MKSFIERLKIEDGLRLVYPPKPRSTQCISAYREHVRLDSTQRNGTITQQNAQGFSAQEEDLQPDNTHQNTHIYNTNTGRTSKEGKTDNGVEDQEAQEWTELEKLHAAFHTETNPSKRSDLKARYKRGFEEFRNKYRLR